jgi:hypothetical protein
MTTENTTLAGQSTVARGSALKTATLAAGALAAGALVLDGLGETRAAHAADMSGDLAILNYALALEHIENAMYKALLSSGYLYGQAYQYASTFGAHEHTHVVALTATIKKLGGTPVAAQATYHFPMLTSLGQIIGLLVTVEDLGASAYLGAAPMIKDATLLETAVAIHTVEAEHATAWRRMAGLNTVPFAFAPPSSMSKVLAAVRPFLG